MSRSASAASCGRWADTAGFTWVDVSDHFYESPMTDKRGPYLECLASLAALAVDTEHVRVGTCVLAMDYRHPAVLANALATIDHLSDGRLDAGLGAGWNVQEYSAYGITFDRIGKRLDRLEEGIHVLRALWEEPEASYAGEHFQLTDALCEPKPLQDRVPIWIGGVGEQRTLQLVARYADGWNAPYLNVDDWQRLSGVLDEWCERVDRDPSEIQRDVNLSFHMAAGWRRVELGRKPTSKKSSVPPATRSGSAARSLERQGRPSTCWLHTPKQVLIASTSRCGRHGTGMRLRAFSRRVDRPGSEAHGLSLRCTIREFLAVTAHFQIARMDR